MTSEQSEKDEQTLLQELAQRGVKRLETLAGAPERPNPQTSEFLDFLDDWAARIELGHPKAPAILRQENRFVREGREQKQKPFRSIRSVLRSLVIELHEKDLSDEIAKRKSE